MEPQAALLKEKNISFIIGIGKSSFLHFKSKKGLFAHIKSFKRSDLK
jgi:hypothetical protein